jgi:fructose 1,6-bisphosphatase
VASHGPAVHVHYSHNGDEHKLNITHEDGHSHESVHSTAAEAYEAGGDKAWTDVKRESHPDQQGARSEEMNYEQTETA